MSVPLPEPLQPLLSRSADSIPLVPKSPYEASLRHTIHSLATQNDWPPALEASLHLLNDDCSQAHDIVTDKEDDMACCLSHAILHRREGDYWNSLYWARQLSHPFIDSFYGSRSQCVDFFKAVESLAKGGGRGGSTTACGAKQGLDGIKGRQEAELKGLVKCMWEQSHAS